MSAPFFLSDAEHLLGERAAVTNSGLLFCVPASSAGEGHATPRMRPSLLPQQRHTERRRRPGTLGGRPPRTSGRELRATNRQTNYSGTLHRTVTTPFCPVGTDRAGSHVTPVAPPAAGTGNVSQRREPRENSLGITTPVTGSPGPS